jgi:hypothetical protein
VVTKRKPCGKITYHHQLQFHSTGTQRSKLKLKKKNFFETAANNFINHTHHLLHGDVSIYVFAVTARTGLTTHA